MVLASRGKDHENMVPAHFKFSGGDHEFMIAAIGGGDHYYK